MSRKSTSSAHALITGLAVALVAGVVLACASSGDLSESAPEPESPEDHVVEVSGRVTVAGSDPHVMLVLVGAEEHYELVGDHAPALWHLQQRRVTVRGRVVRQAYGPGFPAQLEVEEFRISGGG